MRTTQTLEIIAVGLEGGTGHEHIAHLQWQGASSSGVTSSEALMAWLREDPQHEAWLTVGGQRVGVEVVTPIGAPPYLRSRSEGKWGDHLLAVPRLRT